MLPIEPLRYSSSLREIPIAETLRRARRVAADLGVSRLTEVTYLDRVGVPVFVAIRPDAQPGSLCVSAGKGLLPEEAQVGALMECIELAWAEHGRAALPTRWVRTRDLLNGAVRAFPAPGEPVPGFLALAPHRGQHIDTGAEVLAVSASDLRSGEVLPVPAETIFHPLPATCGGARYYGTGTNGLASGNTEDEATLHALSEVIERDITSFHLVRDGGIRVAAETLPPRIATLYGALLEHGFDLVVRYLPNAFGLPCFTAVLFDRFQPELTLRGDGCHPNREIALVRAVTETIQCRLSLIHGGRDDLVNVYAPFLARSAAEKQAIYERELQRLMTPDCTSYAALPDPAPQLTSIVAGIDILTAALASVGLERVLKVRYTPSDYPVVVLRILVPGLECHSRDNARVGPRLRRFRSSLHA